MTSLDKRGRKRIKIQASNGNGTPVLAKVSRGGKITFESVRNGRKLNIRKKKRN